MYTVMVSKIESALCFIQRILAYMNLIVRKKIFLIIGVPIFGRTMTKFRTMNHQLEDGRVNYVI